MNNLSLDEIVKEGGKLVARDVKNLKNHINNSSFMDALKKSVDLNLTPYVLATRNRYLRENPEVVKNFLDIDSIEYIFDEKGREQKIIPESDRNTMSEFGTNLASIMTAIGYGLQIFGHVYMHSRGIPTLPIFPILSNTISYMYEIQREVKSDLILKLKYSENN